MVAISQVAAILLATVAFAAPVSHIESRVPRRHRSRPIRRIERDNLAIDPASHEYYTTNWAGAMLQSPNRTYNAVSGTFVVPTLSSPNSYGAASPWVGIDGTGCSGGLWQAGIDMAYNNGAMSYLPWYEWFPDDSYYFSNIAINAGDTIRLTITADSDTSGKAVIENLSNGQTASQYTTSTHALCRQSAEWVVEDYTQEDSDGTYSLVPFCDFGTVNFFNASARTFSGSTVSPHDSHIVDIQQSDSVLTSTTPNSKNVTISYIG
ncbi:peptidase A4 family-domain-containing protein [Amanita rubescens]|nr:peptidase A4 family-domain-containing protein [Amanita rubescens]